MTESQPLKPRFPRDVAEAIKVTFSPDMIYNEPLFREIMQFRTSNAPQACTKEAAILYNYFENHGYLLLAKALDNGYEVEESPEDRLREHYKHLMNLAKVEIGDKNGAFLGQMSGMLHTLTELNLKIPGINEETP